MVIRSSYCYHLHLSFLPLISLEEVPIDFPEMSVRNFVYSLSNKTEGLCSHLLPIGSLKVWMYDRHFYKINSQFRSEIFNFFNPEQNLYGIVLCNAWLRKGNILRVSGKNVCRSNETDCNRLMWNIREQEAFIICALYKTQSYQTK
jgi:hypothetical protein